MKSSSILCKLGAAAVAAVVLTLSGASALQAARWTFSDCDLSEPTDRYGGPGLMFRLSLNAGGTQADAIRSALAPQILNMGSQLFAGRFSSWEDDGIATMERDLRKSRGLRLDLSTYRFWNERFKYDYKKRLEDKERKRDLPIW